MKNKEDGIPQAEMTGEDWKAQKLVSEELRKLRELSGMTRKELADKMGPPYTEELVAQYEWNSGLCSIWCGPCGAT